MVLDYWSSWDLDKKEGNISGVFRYSSVIRAIKGSTFDHAVGAMMLVRARNEAYMRKSTSTSSALC